MWIWPINKAGSKGITGMKIFNATPVTTTTNIFRTYLGFDKVHATVLVQIRYYPSFSIAFSCIWSICSWEISSNNLHQSLPLIIKLNFWSSGCTHLPFVRMSAFIGSEGENHLHDRQFSDCQDSLLKLFTASVTLKSPFWNTRLVRLLIYKD